MECIRHAVIAFAVAVAPLITGCSMMPVNVAVEDAAGRRVAFYAIARKDARSLLAQQYDYLSRGAHEQCRGIPLVLRKIGITDCTALNSAERLAAYATLFTYNPDPGSLTELENEKRNLVILKAALDGFSKTGGVWREESGIVRAVILGRRNDPVAFDHFVSLMRESSRSLIAGGSSLERAEVVTRIATDHPSWAASTDVRRLQSIPWKGLDP